MRYRDNACGVTNKSLRAAKRNLAKLGEVTEVRGYRFTSTRKPKGYGAYTIQHECILLKGPKGSYRVEGCLWSYLGEGTRGLSQILQACGIDKIAADTIAFNTPRGHKNGTDFNIKFPVPIPIDPNKIKID